MRYDLLFVSLFILTFSEFTIACPPTDNWQVLPLQGSGQRLGGIAFGDGLFVAAGAEGEIMSSVDGINWTDLTSIPESHDYFDVRFGDNTFIAAGGPVIQTLTGPAAGARTTYQNGTVVSLAYGNGTWVSVGGVIVDFNWSSFFLRSTDDGASWTQEGSIPVSGALQNLLDVAFGNGVFLAVAGSGDVYGSIDGTNWSKISSGVLFYPKSITFADGQFYVGAGNGRIYRSVNGFSWSHSTVGSSSWFDVAYHDGDFVAVGQGGNLATSTNGSSWTMQSSGTTDALESVEGSVVGWVAVGPSSGSQRIVTESCPPAADLSPFALSGWSDPIQVRRVGETASGTVFGDTDMLEVDAAWANLGVGDAGAFVANLNVSGVGAIDINSSGLASGFAQNVLSIQLGSLAVGSYDLILTVDSAAQVPESDESNNSFPLSITIQ